MNNFPNSAPLANRLGGVNIYLVGMMGCGKSRTGPCLAKGLSYGFVDIDAVIEKIAHRPIAQIFAEDGENGFRALESQVLNAIGQRYRLVVATGGGLVTRKDNWGTLHQGIIVWIDPDRDILLKRLQTDQVKRPLLNNEDPAGSLDLLLKERIPLYKEADLHITVENESPQAVSEKILESLPMILKN